MVPPRRMNPSVLLALSSMLMMGAAPQPPPVPVSLDPRRLDAFARRRGVNVFELLERHTPEELQTMMDQEEAGQEEARRASLTAPMEVSVCSRVAGVLRDQGHVVIELEAHDLPEVAPARVLVPYSAYTSQPARPRVPATPPEWTRGSTPEERCRLAFERRSGREGLIRATLKEARKRASRTGKDFAQMVDLLLSERAL